MGQAWTVPHVQWGRSEREGAHGFRAVGRKGSFQPLGWKAGPGSELPPHLEGSAPHTWARHLQQADPVLSGGVFVQELCQPSPGAGKVSPWPCSLTKQGRRSSHATFNSGFKAPAKQDRGKHRSMRVEEVGREESRA